MNLHEAWLSLTPWTSVRESYSKGEKIGEGTFGTVYDATKGSQAVAIKSVICESDMECKLVLTEIELLKKVGYHRNIVRLLDAFRAEVEHPPKVYRRAVLIFDRALFDSMQFVTIAGNPSLRMFQFLSLDLFSGVAHLHQLSIMHRDLKPANLLISNEDERMKLAVADFGTCKQVVVPEDTPKENFYFAASMVCTTHRYCAPEILKSRQYWFSSDMWACAVTLSELKTGIPFINLESNAALPSILSVLESSLARVFNLMDGDDDLTEVILSSFAADPKQRPTATWAKTQLFAAVATDCKPKTQGSRLMTRLRRKTSMSSASSAPSSKKRERAERADEEIRLTNGKIFRPL